MQGCGEQRLPGVSEGRISGRICRGILALKNPLDTLTGTIISGLIITIVLYVIVKAAIPVGS